MSTTISTGKKMTLYVDPRGHEWWLMEEETYSSNTFPQTRRWSQISFGDTQKTRENVIRFSASCEGGTLHGASGHILAESYITQWRSEMILPRSCEDIDISIKTCPYSYTEEMRLKGANELSVLSNSLGIEIQGGELNFTASFCSHEQLQIISAAMHNRAWGLRYEYRAKHKATTDSWRGEWHPSEVINKVSNIVGVQTSRSKYYAVEVNGKAYFDMGWGVQSEIIRDLALTGVTLTEAISFCKKLRKDIKANSNYVEAITLQRPAGDWYYDHIMPLEGIFGGAEVTTIDMKLFDQLESKIFDIYALAKTDQFKFKVVEQDALFA